MFEKILLLLKIKKLTDIGNKRQRNKIKYDLYSFDKQVPFI